jgi:ATP-dependent helicase/DNAse subunit B
VLHAIWAGPPEGIRTRDQLQNLKDRSAFVAGHVHRVFLSEIRREVREIMPRRYLELEAQRLIRLVTEWLDYEATRIDFEVERTEVERTITLAGLTLNLRLDRIDRLNDGTVLIIDYKSGDVSPHAWDLPRPDDVQLPLYAGFALKSDEILGGLVFAKIRAGNQAFVGSVAAAKDTLLPNLSGGSSLIKNSLTLDQLLDWRNCIQQLARDFVDGNAEVAPREAPQTCARCGLQTLCRIHENESLLQPEAGDDFDGSTSQEAADE